MGDWENQFRGIYQRAVSSYRGGIHSARKLFNPAEIQFLASIGCSSQELFDFVEDFVRFQEPSFEDVLSVTAVRRDYFLQVQGGQVSSAKVDMSKLPAKSAEASGIRWLPRIIIKAQAKLRGEMPDELMYLCGGDRAFFSTAPSGSGGLSSFSLEDQRGPCDYSSRVQKAKEQF